MRKDNRDISSIPTVHGIERIQYQLCFGDILREDEEINAINVLGAKE